MLLDVVTWDLVTDAHNDIAAASAPYALAQDAASADRTFLGEVFWDTTIGVPYLTQILAKRPSLALVKAQLVAQAETIPGVASAKVFISAISDRVVEGQVQVTPEDTSLPTAVASFTATNPQVD